MPIAHFVGQTERVEESASGMSEKKRFWYCNYKSNTWVTDYGTNLFYFPNISSNHQTLKIRRKKLDRKFEKRQGVVPLDFL